MSNRPQDKWFALVLLVIFLSASTLCDIHQTPPVDHRTILNSPVDKQEVDRRVKNVEHLNPLNTEYVTLMAKLIEHEARGESFQGKLAVVNVLINRCFGDKKLMKREAFRKNAFTGFEKAYPDIKPSKESIRAAEQVLSGTRVVSRGTRYFLNRRVATDHWIERNCKFEKRIGNHSFYSKGGN